MKPASWGAATFLVLGTALACSGESAEAPSALASPDRVLCARCQPPPAGGETGDFLNSTGGCGVTITDVGRDFDEPGLNARAAIELVEQSASVPGHYVAARSLAIAADPAEVSGHGADPIVDVAVEVTRVQLFEQIPGSLRGSQCSQRWLSLDASTSIHTSDGALSGRFEHGLVALFGDGEAQLFAWQDASSFRGSLEFGEPITALGAGLYLLLSPAGVRGRVDMLATLAGEPERYGAIALEWPVDACEIEQTPVLEEEYLPLLEQARAVAGAQPPLLARWQDGSDTELRVTLNAPIDAACRTRSRVSSAAEASYEFVTPVQLATSDARISGSVPGVFDVRTDEDGELTVINFDTFQRFRAAELESAFGIHGVDLRGAECGALSIHNNFNLTSGSLVIGARPCDDSTDEPAESLRWCPGPPCDFGESPLR